jgi:hypothetical protein
LPLKLIKLLSNTTPVEFSQEVLVEQALITESSQSDMDQRTEKSTILLRTHGDQNGEITDTSNLQLKTELESVVFNYNHLSQKLTEFKFLKIDVMNIFSNLTYYQIIVYYLIYVSNINKF